MRKAVVLLALAALAGPAAGQAPPPAQAGDWSSGREIEGRWNLTIREAGEVAPGWLEVAHSGPRMLVGRFVGAGGSARPISRIYFSDGHMRFAIPPQWEQEPNDLVVAGRFEGDTLSGTMILPSGELAEWSGRRAPALRRAADPVWGQPIDLIPESGLAGWHVIGGESEWEVVDGVLRNRESGGNLVTDRSFEDFKLHLEFRVPEGSNSGVYLRGRYEVQITDSDPGDTGYGTLGAVYGFLIPTEVPARPGEWQSYDITLVGRLVTIALNGTTVITRQEIPGTTGGALDSDEGAPGPLVLQGDHGPVEFRNIVITPAR